MDLKDYDLNKLYVFAVVAKAKSMTGAAKALGRTPSAISQSISQLEKSFDTALFRRIGIAIHLTEEGKVLLQGFKQIQSELEKTLEATMQSRAELVGPIRIGMFPGFQMGALLDSLNRILNEHPRTQIHFRFLSHADLAKNLVENKIDFCFSLIPLSRIARKLISQTFARERLVLASAKTAKLPSPTRSTLAEIPVIEYFQSPSLYSEWCKYSFGVEPKRINARAYAQNLESVEALVNAGFGYAIMPESRIRSKLAVCRTEKNQFIKSIYINRVRNSPLTRQAAELMRLLEP